MVTKTATPKLAPIVLILPEGTPVRTKDRKSGEEKRVNTDKTIKLTGKDVTSVTLSDRTKTKIVGFQYKGRKATVKLRKCLRAGDSE